MKKVIAHNHTIARYKVTIEFISRNSDFITCNCEIKPQLSFIMLNSVAETASY